MLPFKFKYNRVRRSYTGGKGIDMLRGIANSADGEYPEDWIASCVKAFARKGENPNSGISVIDDRECTLFTDLLSSEGELLLGSDHLKKHGNETGFLMKLLDSSIRLPVQAHPDKQKALSLFNSPYGKTEAWLILATRPAEEEMPYILIGFNEKLDKNIFIRESIEGELRHGLEMMHKIPVEPGELYMIRGGLPHALGPGLTVIEIMEPSDWIVISERKCGDILIDEARRFNGLEAEQAMSIFDFTPVSIEELKKNCVVKPVKIDSYLNCLIDRGETGYFGLETLTLSGTYELQNSAGCCRAGIVTNGQTVVNSRLTLQSGDAFFLPACQKNVHFSGSADIVLALPPQSPVML